MATRLALRSLVSIAFLSAFWLVVFTPAGLSRELALGAALLIISLSLWATSLIPEHITALIFFLFAMLFAVAPADVVFSGFSSTALWLIFGGLVIGAAINSTGLGVRVANIAAQRLHGSYLKIIAGTVAIGVLIGFVMPSSIGRILLFVPIAISLADHFGFDSDSNGYKGIILAAVFGAHIPTFSILPANVPNMVFVGSTETLLDISFLYGEYFLLHFPVLGLLKSLVLIGLIVWMFPDKPREQSEQSPAINGISRQEWQLACLLAIALGLWMTDFLHHISPAWISLAVAILLMLPRTGILPAKAMQNLNYNSLFFVAGIMGLGAMVNHTGLATVFGEQAINKLPLGTDQSLLNFVMLWATSFASGVVTTLPGVPAVLTPLAEQISEVTGLPLKTVLMTQVLGFSTVLFPYQSAPMIVGMQLAKVSIGNAFKLCVAVTAVTFLVLMPLDYVWWRVLGWI